MTSEDIYNLLSKNSRVIVPELGAFMIKPANNSIIFNEFLKFNDGLLIDYLSKKGNSDKSEVIKEINEFTRNIYTTLDKENICDLGLIGNLTIDMNGKIQLVKSGNIDNKHTQLEDLLNNDVKIETQSQDIPYTIPELSLSTKEAESHMYNLEARSDLEYPEMMSSAEYILNKEIRRKKVFVFFTVTILTVIIVLYLAFFRNASFVEQIQQPKTVKHLQNKESVVKKSLPAPVVTENTTHIQPPVTSVNQDSSEKPKEIQKIEKTETHSLKNEIVKQSPPIKTEPKSSIKPVTIATEEINMEKKFHIIAGVFSVEKNAEKQVQHLKQQGYDARIVRKIGNNCYVSYSSFSTKEEAQAKLKSIQSTGSTGWIVKF
jgi:hypothetical protein